MNDPPTPADLNRRDFALTIATSALVAGAVGAIGETALAEDAVPKPLSSVDRLVELIRHEHPHARLDELAIAEIRTDVEQQLARSAVLAGVPLTNGDEPGVLFQPYRRN